MIGRVVRRSRSKPLWIGSETCVRRSDEALCPNSCILSLPEECFPAHTVIKKTLLWLETPRYLDIRPLTSCSHLGASVLTCKLRSLVSFAVVTSVILFNRASSAIGELFDRWNHETQTARYTKPVDPCYQTAINANGIQVYSHGSDLDRQSASLDPVRYTDVLTFNRVPHTLQAPP